MNNFERGKGAKSPLGIGILSNVKKKVESLRGEVIHLNAFAKDVTLDNFEYGIDEDLMSKIKDYDKTPILKDGFGIPIRVITDDINYITIRGHWMKAPKKGTLKNLWDTIKDIDPKKCIFSKPPSTAIGHQAGFSSTGSNNIALGHNSNIKW